MADDEITAVAAASGEEPASGEGAPAGEKTILQRIAAGDPHAVQDCMDTYGGLIWSMARKKGLPAAEADDIVQEVFIQLWKSAERYDPSLASETTFVAMIARRRLIDRLRKVGRRPRTQEIVPDLHDKADGEHQQLEARVELSVAQKALGVLRPKERHVVLLSAYHGMSHSQIAEETGIPLGTVKTYIRRGLMRVKEALDESDRAATDIMAASDSSDSSGSSGSWTRSLAFVAVLLWILQATTDESQARALVDPAAETVADLEPISDEELEAMVRRAIARELERRPSDDAGVRHPRPAAQRVVS